MCPILYLGSSIAFFGILSKYILNIKCCVWWGQMRNQGWRVGVVILFSQKLLAWYGPAHVIASPWTWKHSLPQAPKPAHLEAIAIMSRNKPFYYFFGYWSLPQRSTSFSPIYYLLNYWLYLSSSVLQSTGNSSALYEVSKMIDNASVIISAWSLRTFR